MGKKPNAAATRAKLLKDFPAAGVEMWPIAQIKPYPRNARTHPPGQVKMLANIFLTVGVDQPIVVDADDHNYILKGHGRLLAAIEAGMTEFPVVPRRGLTEAEKIAMRIEDNQVALLSGWDKELLRGEMMVLQKGGYDLNLLGFGEAQLVQFTTTPGPPSQFEAFGEDIPTEFCCPKCGFRWSGKADASARADEQPPAPKPKRAPAAKAKKR